MPDAQGSRARAEALANKLLGDSGAHMAADTVMAGMKSGTRDADGNVLSVDGPFSGAKSVPKAHRPEPEELDEVAELDTDDELEEEGDDDELQDPDESVDYDEDGESDDEEDDGDNDEDPDEAEEDQYEEIPYSDDDEFDVTVDGELRTVSLRELKNRYSLQGATEKRLQEATETRKAAHAERQEFLQEAETYRTNLVNTLQQLDGVLFQPLVQPPDPALRSSNINRYLQLKDYYDEDQRRVKEARAKMGQFFDQQKQATDAAMLQYREQQTQLLVEKLPELRDPQRGPKVQKEIMEAAAHYGFTPKQVQQVNDHALFLMARDAARWLNMQKLRGQNGGKPATSEGAKRRKMKPGSSVSARKQAAVQNSKQQRALEAQAKASGREGDVANFLAGKAKVRRNKIGRSS